jgi:hypothetical protein
MPAPSRAGEASGVIAPLSGGWQTTIADLALILFLVTAAGLDAVDREARDDASVPARGEPLAVYSAADDAPPLGEWLAEQAPDERQHLTVVAQYRPGRASEAAARALELASQAGAASSTVRIVIEVGPSEKALALLAYDRPADVARTLQRTEPDR